MSNIITRDQWQQITDAIKSNVLSYNEPSDVVYESEESRSNKTRHFICDNYDRGYVPRLDFVIEDDKDIGKLTVFDCSEMANAPITFKEGMQIARNFWNESGSQMSEEIVCDYVMCGNPRIILFNQESC